MSERIETIININYPFKKVERSKVGPLWMRKLSWFLRWGRCSIQEFGGKRVNTVRHFYLFCWHVLTIRRNQYHDLSDKERADEYLKKWSACEKELRGLKLIVFGETLGADVKKLIRESLGVDFDEGTIL